MVRLLGDDGMPKMKEIKQKCDVSFIEVKMDWLEEVKGKIKRGNEILFSPKDAFLLDLATLIDGQNHKTMVLWALELAEEAVRILEERYPKETRPRAALETTRLWKRTL